MLFWCIRSVKDWPCRSYHVAMVIHDLMEKDGSCWTIQIGLSLEKSAKIPGVKRMFEKLESQVSCVIKKRKTAFSSELWAGFGHLD